MSLLERSVVEGPCLFLLRTVADNISGVVGRVLDHSVVGRCEHNRSCGPTNYFVELHDGADGWYRARLVLCDASDQVKILVRKTVTNFLLSIRKSSCETRYVVFPSEA